MELPGRDSMCRRVDLRIHRAGSLAPDLTYEARVEGFDDRTNMLRVAGILFQDDTAVASCSLGVHWRRGPQDG